MDVSVELSGPFFEKDPVKTFRQNARAGLEELAKEAEADVRAAAPYYTGPRDDGIHLRDHIVGRVKSLKGKPWALTAVVSSLLHYRLKSKSYAGKTERRLRFFRRGIRRARRLKRDLLKGLH